MARRRKLPYLQTVAFCLSVFLCVWAFSATAQLQSGVVINFADVHQRIDGFGASDAYLGTFSDAQADMFFSTSSGIGLSIYRTAIDENGDKFRGAYSNATKAAARGAIVWAAPWTAPGAWKDNGTPGNGGHLLPAFYDAWATRLAGFAAKLQQLAGVTLWGLSVQNEPDYTAPYESMIFTYQEMANFVKVLGPKLAAMNPRPKLISPETSSWGNGFNYSGAILNDAVAAPYLDIIGVHQYAGLAAPPNSARPIWQTEMSSFDNFEPSIFNGLGVARWVHDAITIGNVNAYHYWWFYGHDATNQGLIGHDNGMQPTKRFYTFGNFSKFVRPGFYVVGTSGAPSGVSLTAYKNPATGAFVIVAINAGNGDVPVNVSLSGLTATSVTPWVTSSVYDLAPQTAIPVSGGGFTATLPLYSVTSFVGAGGSTGPPAAPTGLVIH